MREITVDDLFEWGDDLALKAKQTFGTHALAVSNRTFLIIRERCFMREVEAASYLSPPRSHINSVTISVVDGVPDGIIRGLGRSTEGAAQCRT